MAGPDPKASQADGEIGGGDREDLLTNRLAADSVLSPVTARHYCPPAGLLGRFRSKTRPQVRGEISDATEGGAAKSGSCGRGDKCHEERP